MLYDMKQMILILKLLLLTPQISLAVHPAPSENDFYLQAAQIVAEQVAAELEARIKIVAEQLALEQAKREQAAHERKLAICRSIASAIKTGLVSSYKLVTRKTENYKETGAGIITIAVACATVYAGYRIWHNIKLLSN